MKQVGLVMAQRTWICPYKPYFVGNSLEKWVDWLYQARNIYLDTLFFASNLSIFLNPLFFKRVTILLKFIATHAHTHAYTWIGSMSSKIFWYVFYNKFFWQQYVYAQLRDFVHRLYYPCASLPHWNESCFGVWHDQTHWRMLCCSPHVRRHMVSLQCEISSGFSSFPVWCRPLYNLQTADNTYT